MGDIRPLAIDDTDSVIRGFHYDLQSVNGDLAKLDPEPTAELPKGISNDISKVASDTVTNIEPQAISTGA